MNGVIMKSLMSKYLLPVVALAAVGWAVPVFASSGVTTSYIENTFVTSTTSFPQSPGNFLITLGGYNNICPKSGFAYVLETDSYYVSVENAVNSARGERKNVHVYWSTDASGYCHITSVTIVT
jgi:hypothetical protein